jgi:cytidylate kinase
MASANFIITIDGPAGSGKTTVARKVAEKLGFRFLDTGAMYRAATLAAIEADLAEEPLDADAVVRAVKRADLRLDEGGTVRLGGREVQAEIRSTRVTQGVSLVAAAKPVRKLLVGMQREFGERAQPGLVAEGRDMATVVFPRAAHRFFLDASPEIRAGRRLRELDGTESDPRARAVIRADMLARDRRDSTRNEAPLRVGPGVEVIDTGALSVDQVVERIVKAVGAPA